MLTLLLLFVNAIFIPESFCLGFALVTVALFYRRSQYVDKSTGGCCMLSGGDRYQLIIQVQKQTEYRKKMHKKFSLPQQVCRFCAWLV